MLCVEDFTFLFVQIIPDHLQEKWQSDLEALNLKLGGTEDEPIAKLLIMLETPEEMIVLCTAGEGVRVCEK